MSSTAISLFTKKVLESFKVENSEVYTTSRDVAFFFEKLHKDVLRLIDNADFSDDFNQRNFTLIKNLDSRGREQPEYLMTRDAFSFIVMGFTGKKAAMFKEAFISAFNQMEKELRESKVVKAPDNLYDALKLSLTLLEENLDLKEKLRLAEEETEMLEKKAAKFKTKAETLDVLTDADRSISMGQMAKTLGFGRNRFMAFLRQIEYLDKYNVAYESRRKYFNVIQKKLKREKFQTVTLINSVGIAHFGRMKLRGIFEELI
jgi:Rha family phage regulatory protein